MDALETLLLAAALPVSLYLLVQCERARLRDPAHVRSVGAQIGRDELVADGAEVIGSYDGCEIYACVLFMGMHYRFEGVVPSSYRSRIGPRELYVAPGLLYVTD